MGAWDQRQHLEARFVRVGKPSSAAPVFPSFLARRLSLVKFFGGFPTLYSRRFLGNPRILSSKLIWKLKPTSFRTPLSIPSNFDLAAAYTRTVLLPEKCLEPSNSSRQLAVFGVK